MECTLPALPVQVCTTSEFMNATFEHLIGCHTNAPVPADFSTSTHISAEFSQKTAEESPSFCESMKGMDPYKAIGLSISYSNTSKLYRRYGSLNALSLPLQNHHY